MFSRNIYLILLCVGVVCHEAKSHPNLRYGRSPDTTMEIVIPDNSPDYEANGEDYDKQRNEEEQYWQSQGDRAENDYENAKESNDTEENYENEKEYRGDQNEKYGNEANETYNTQHENADNHQASNQEHYGNNNDDNEDNMNEFKNDSGNTYDRYEEKGEDGMNKEQDKAENYDTEGKSPSVSYTTN